MRSQAPIFSRASLNFGRPLVPATLMEGNGYHLLLGVGFETELGVDGFHKKAVFSFGEDLERRLAAQLAVKALEVSGYGEENRGRESVFPDEAVEYSHRNSYRRTRPWWRVPN